MITTDAALPAVEQWEQLGYSQISELAMHNWLRLNGYADAVYEGNNRIVLAYNADGSPRRWTLPDFTVTVGDQRVAIEITVCRKKGHECPERAIRHRRELKFKQERAQRIHQIGFAYLVVEGKWLGEILSGSPQAAELFHWQVRREARRARKMALRIKAHEEQRYRPRRRRPHQTRSHTRYRSLPSPA